MNESTTSLTCACCHQHTDQLFALNGRAPAIFCSNCQLELENSAYEEEEFNAYSEDY